MTKYRYPVLGGDVGKRCRELVRETARTHEMVIHAGAINRDHVHLLLSIPPSLSVSRAVQYLKARSSQRLLSEFGSLRKRYWGQHLCARGYWVASSSGKRRLWLGKRRLWLKDDLDRAITRTQSVVADLAEDL